MDGAGRSRRSRGSPGPKTDLKAAAIGAAVLLREYFGFDRKRVKARADRTPPNRVILFLERMMPRRAVLMLTLATLLTSAVLGVIKGGHVDAVLAQLADSRNAMANSAGFRITSVIINGRKQLSQDEVLGIGGVNGRSSLLFLDAATVRDKLKANPWIADATVLKFYPGQLQHRDHRAHGVCAVATGWPACRDRRGRRGAGALCGAPLRVAAAGGGQGRRDPRA
nr:POTRA domain, FtsQ-type [uncultured bacterium]